MKTIEFNGKTYDRSHGSPFDRGSSDYYYWRSPNPHKWLDSMGANRVELTDAEEIAAYAAGYAWGEDWGERKDYR
jgi:hypothetical protein